MSFFLFDKNKAESEQTEEKMELRWVQDTTRKLMHIPTIKRGILNRPRQELRTQSEP